MTSPLPAPSGPAPARSGARVSLLRRAGPLLCLLAVTAAGYAPALGGGFQFDDERAITANPAMKDLPAFLRERFLPSFLADGRPVTDLTFAVTHELFGLRPEPWHAGNVLVHLAATLLAFALARETLRRAGWGDRPGVALAAAGIFALHPLQTEAVSYVVQRSEALASAFFLAGLLLLLRCERAVTAAGRAGLLVAGLAAYVAGLGSKLVAVTLPAALLLHALAFPGRAGRAGALRRAGLLAAPLAAVGALFAWLNLRRFSGRADVGFDVPGLTARDYLLSQPRAIAGYLRLALWPAGQSIDHAFAPSRALDAPTLAALALVLAGLAWALATLARSPSHPAKASRLAAFGSCWFLLLLAPTSSVVPLADLMVEHRVYLALLGPALATAAIGSEALGPRARRLGPVLVLVAGGALFGALLARNQVWRDRVSLWRDAVAKGPGKSRTHANYGQALFLAGRLPEAEAEFRFALALARDGTTRPPELYRNLGAVLIQQRRMQEAAQALSQGLAWSPGDPDLLNNYAIALHAVGLEAQSERYARQAIAASPGHAGAHNTLGEVLLALGRPEQALREFLAAVSLDPDAPVMAHNVAVTEEAIGDAAEACRWWAYYRTLPGADPRRADARQPALGCGE
ncbi:tetratricopeptide repeat protein [Anaeromyxobacter paludicola]|uniref:Tetratricopeptide repeat protein n=1 Tax=Anaeromyxobacter paludicola TaxID=2918171 RepID=A0ABN6N2L0_9BACT|nr:tetratricopeptide repeat protein [Anaeromyxobacter paludicola]BDG07403.1 hypothetical protein AMPC_05160 [Anaeromyxobacter paludicola]